MSWRSPGYSYSYTVGRPPRQGAVTSRTEVLHLSIAFIVLTVDFMLILGPSAFFTGSLLELAAVAAAAALTAFVFHEMAHKVSAQLGGYWAEFRMSPFGLVVSLITAYLGFLWAAPGATMIGGMGNVRDWGRTSLAGPATNFVFALGFLSVALATATVAAWANASSIFLFLAYINGWFAAFNMIPWGPLDGAKVLRWSRSVWVLAFVIFAALAGLLLYLVDFASLPRL